MVLPIPDLLKVTVIKEDKPESYMLSLVKLGEKHAFEDLTTDFLKRYPEFLDTKHIKFYWIDMDNDKIIIANNRDYDLYMQSLVGATGRIYCDYCAIIKRLIPEKRLLEMGEESSSNFSSAGPTVPENAPIHARIVCDACKKMSFKGHRYKCIQCFDYDLCMNCEMKFEHKDHVMLRFPSKASKDTISAYASFTLPLRRFHVVP